VDLSAATFRLIDHSHFHKNAAILLARMGCTDFGELSYFLQDFR
jgi:hypothetical protein